MTGPPTRLRMPGVIAIRHIVTDFLRERFPDILTDLRVEWGLDVTDLPDPVKYVPNDPDATDVYPTIAVVTGVESATRRIENTPDGGAYWATYPIEVYGWTVTSGRGEAQDMRDRMAAALKITLLANPTFATDRNVDVGLDENTLRQSYSDVVKTRGGDRFVTASQTAFDVTTAEMLGGFGATLSPQVATVNVSGISRGTPFGVEATPLHPVFD